MMSQMIKLAEKVETMIANRAGEQLHLSRIDNVPNRLKLPMDCQNSMVVIF